MTRTEPQLPAADRALVAAVLERAPGAFERLVREYQGLCWRIIYRMVRHPDDARELCQETFLRVHLRLPQFRFESALKTWIGAVAYSIALRHLERKRVPLVWLDGDEGALQGIEEIGDEFDLESASADEQLVAAMRAEVDALPPLPRTILMLYHLEEWPIEQIARATGMPEGSIKSHLFRGRARLRARLQLKVGVLI